MRIHAEFTVLKLVDEVITKIKEADPGDAIFIEEDLRKAVGRESLAWLSEAQTHGVKLIYGEITP